MSKIFDVGSGNQGAGRPCEGGRPVGQESRPVGLGKPAGHARLPPPGSFPSAWPRLVGFWLTLGAFLGSFGVRFSVRKIRELKFDIPWSKRKRFGVKQAYGLTGMSSQSWVVENGWRAEKRVTKAWSDGSVSCCFSSKASRILSRHRAVTSRRPKIIAGQNGVSTYPPFLHKKTYLYHFSTLNLNY